MPYKSSSNKTEQFELLVKDINMDITEQQKSEHQKLWNRNHKWVVDIGKCKLYRKAKDGWEY